MCAKNNHNKIEAQNPLILRCHRLMEAFAKSDDERDFYIDRLEGFLIYVDLDKSQAELETLENDLKQNSERYCMIPKLSFYETKKIMEGFVNEKVYDIDTKEKLLDIIQSKEARENFLEFIHDHHAEQEKWQQFYQERSRIRIIEWLRANHFHFVFEEDLDLPRHLIEKIKQFLFQAKVGKDIMSARKALILKAKTYYSNEALNPRPKRGRPPKQAIKPDIEPQITTDIYTTVPIALRPFLFTPELTPSSISAFSSKFDKEEDLLIHRRLGLSEQEASLNHKLATLRSLSSRWLKPQEQEVKENSSYLIDQDFDQKEDDDDDFEEELLNSKKLKPKTDPANNQAQSKSSKASSKAKSKPEKPKAKRIIPPSHFKKEKKSDNKGLKKNDSQNDPHVS